MSSLKVVHENKCIGCEMCVMECQRQLERVGLAGSYIRILRNLDEGDKFEVSVDPKITQLKIKTVVSVCPRGVFEETEEDGGT